MHKMPIIWIDYCQFLVDQKFTTLARKTFDRALQALPVTQHNRIWPLYLSFVKNMGVWETGVRVYRRFLKLDSGQREEYVEYLESVGRWDDAGTQLAAIVNDDTFVSRRGATKHSLWMHLCDLLSKHPEDIVSLQVEAVIRSGMRRFSDEVGRLWVALADYWIRQGMFGRACDVYEEGIGSVGTVRDFSTIFDAYAQFQETMISAKLELLDAGGGDADGDDVDLRLARLDALMRRRPEQLSSVMLRQNPHNVHEWLKRTQLFKDDPHKTIVAFTEAVKTVDPHKALGRPGLLWIEFAKFYESHGDLANARAVLRRAVAVPYRSVDELAGVWCALCEMELRHNNYAEALGVMREAVKPPTGREKHEREVAARAAGAAGGEEKRPVQERVHKSLKLWSLYVDLEESLGTVETARAAYDRMIDLRVATPQTVLNYASMLEAKNYFEASFAAFERGINMFSYPHVHDIWLAYLTKFVARYGGAKLERARDLFEQCVAVVPPANAAPIYTLYAQLEETHGLVRHAMAILDRATDKVQESDRYAMYCLYVSKAEEFFGATRTRPVYEKAIEKLPNEQVKDMCLRYATQEIRLGEVDRARAILSHGAQFANPKTVLSYWKTWHEFEVAHGNEDTFRDMLRVKRSVASHFSQAHYMASELLAAEVAAASAIPSDAPAPGPEPGAGTGGVKRKAEEGGAAETEAAAAERQAARPALASAEGDVPLPSVEELDLDAEDTAVVEQRPVPMSVFGAAAAALAKAKEDRGAEPVVGALQRFKAGK